MPDIWTHHPEIVRDLLREDVTLTVEKAKNGTAFVHVPLESHQIAILKHV